jgi:hypothetical protein
MLHGMVLCYFVSSGRQSRLMAGRELILSANAFQSQNKAESVDMECHHGCHTDRSRFRSPLHGPLSDR